MSAVIYQIIQLIAPAAPFPRPACTGITFRPAQAHFQAASPSRAELQRTRCSSGKQGGNRPGHSSLGGLRNEAIL